MSTRAAASARPKGTARRSVLLRRLRGPATMLATLAMALLAGVALRRLLGEVRVRDVRDAFAAIGAARLAAALGFTVASYAALACYDWLALRAIGRSLPWRTSALAAFLSYSVGQSVGLSLLTGGSIRLRVYGLAGLSAGEVARVTLLASATFWTGLAVLAGAAMTFAPGGALPIGGVVAARIGGVVLLGGVGGLLALSVGGVRRVGRGAFALPLPEPRLLALQIAAGVADIGCAAAALYVLAAPAAGAGPLRFATSYVAGVVAGLVSHVPGGLGVFEAAMLGLMPGGREGLFAALLVYRAVYYLLPLGIAAAVMLMLEAHRLRRPVAHTLSIAERVGQATAPGLMATLVFGGGAVLLLSGALPPAHGRMPWLRGLLPLPFVEASHFAASMAGTALLLIAPALQARLRSGRILAQALLLGGALFSIAKGIDYEEAALLAGLAALLHYSRAAFYRTAGIAGAPVSQWWWAAVLAAVLVSVWTGFFAYQHVPYSTDLWWAFAWRGNASRFLRATLGASVLLAAVAVRRLTAAPSAPSEHALPAGVAERALAHTPRSDAALAFTGDKSFLVARAGDAFLMYRQQGRSWIVMGDPVGPEARWSELCWEIRHRSHAAHGRLCFYQASARMLPLIVELGLRPMKYGEEANVDLTRGFALDGKERKKLRYSVNRAEAEGLRFAMLAADEVPAALSALARVSRAWLADKGGAEKRFSVGRFDAAYLSRAPVAVLRRGAEIVAFANLWETPGRSELSVDLMRHLPDAPYGAMDMLFVRLLQWGAAQGYQSFNLGLAPLSGLPARSLAPIWARAGAAIYEHGERLYGFSGLRAFKAKFGPTWVPRYVATPGGLSAPRALIDIATLVGG